MNKLIKILVALAQSNDSNFEAELRSEIDSLGFVTIHVKYINLHFLDILKTNQCALISVSTIQINKNFQ